MATNSAKTTGGNYTLTLTATESNGYVNYRLELTCNYTGAGNGFGSLTCNSAIKINGSQVDSDSSKKNCYSGQTITLLSGTTSQSYSGSITVQGTLTTATSQSYYPKSGSVSVSLNGGGGGGTEPPPSETYLQFTVSDAYVGQAVQITITQKPIQNHRLGKYFTVKAKCGSTYIPICTKTQFETYNWTVPKEVYNYNTTGLELTATIYIDAYSSPYNDVIVDSSAEQAQIYFNEADLLPTLNPTIIQPNETITNTITGSNQKFIRYISTAHITPNINLAYGATAKKIQVVNGSQDYSTTNATAEFDMCLKGIETNTFRWLVEDSRGLKATLEKEVDLIPWVKPTINIDCSNPDSGGHAILTIAGNYYSGSLGLVNGSAILTLGYKWFLNGTAEPAEFTQLQNSQINLTGTTYSVSIPINNFADNDIYKAIVSLSTSISGEIKAQKLIQRTPIWDWGEDWFETNCDAYFNKNVEVLGSLSALALKGNDGQNLIDLIFPVGSIFITQGSTPPNSCLGNMTWTLFKTDTDNLNYYVRDN